MLKGEKGLDSYTFNYMLVNVINIEFKQITIDYCILQ